MCIASRYPPQEFDPRFRFSANRRPGQKALYIEARHAWRVFFAGGADRIEQDRSQGGQRLSRRAAQLRQRLMHLRLPYKSFRLIETCSKLGRDDTA